MNHPDEMYVDIGATSEEEVRKAGVDLLDPVALSVRSKDVGPLMSAEAGPVVGDRFGAAVLKEIAAKLGKAKTQGTTTIAFVTQSWTGGRGLNRLLEEIKPDEMIYLGRIVASTASDKPETQAQLGSGILLAAPEAKTELSEFPGAIQKLATKRGVPLTITVGAPPRIASYTKPNPLPARFAMIGVPTLWPVTPAETVSSKDLKSLEQLIEEYLGFAQAPIESVAGGVPGCENEQPDTPDPRGNLRGERS
jgi:putative aminopeptidase FrvX